MEKYHKYVFDKDNHCFVGKFEEMYRQESIECFDSWHQEDHRQIQRIIDLDILGEYNFNTIVDIGCGKGSFTHLLKKRNNRVIGVDISPTVIEIAKERYHDIEFVCDDIATTAAFSAFCNKINNNSEIDLVFMSEVMSYLECWQEIIASIAEYSKYILVSLYIPEDPIGYVKSEDHLIRELNNFFETVEWITLRNRRVTIFLGRSRKCCTR